MGDHLGGSNEQLRPGRMRTPGGAKAGSAGGAGRGLPGPSGERLVPGPPQPWSSGCRGEMHRRLSHDRLGLSSCSGGETSTELNRLRSTVSTGGLGGRGQGPRVEVTKRNLVMCQDWGVLAKTGPSRPRLWLRRAGSTWSPGQVWGPPIAYPPHPQEEAQEVVPLRHRGARWRSPCPSTAAGTPCRVVTSLLGAWSVTSAPVDSRFPARLPE